MLGQHFMYRRVRSKTIEYPRHVTGIVLNGELNMAAQSHEAPPSELESQSLIGKVSAVTVAAVRRPSCYRNSQASETCACALVDLAWEIRFFITLFEQKKQHLWHSCCLISLIANMKFNRKLSEEFWRILCFPIQSGSSCTWMPERHFKDGRRVTWLVLKRLCYD